MSLTNTLAIFVIFFSAISFAFASDSDTLQDICVALPSSGVKVNGFECKAEANVTEDDFFFAGLANPGVINNTLGSLVTAANVEKIPGLNTLGVSFSRIDYKAGGLNPPHTHPRATEIVFVLEGQLDVAFITTANKLISKSINKGEIFVFPKGLVHYQKNSGDKPASVLSAFNSQLPGTFSVAAALFSSTPTVPDNVLAQAFQIDTKQVDNIKANLAPKKS
ncbi:germin-like protein subfamily 2 member 4 [Vigna umbellata]|uniref:germin-like protein subfamily 2 member 4 n=1 Tax=Vigna umbellata TaxID=87088 RepID=UPI001F5F608D|nr:germin-like protein subfamily 2 member 4 [Vigna umbellata]